MGNYQHLEFIKESKETPFLIDKVLVDDKLLIELKKQNTMSIRTLANLDPAPQGGEWYFAYCSMKSDTKVVVIIDAKHPNLAIQDNNLYSGIAYYYKPEKINYETAKSFLKKTIPELEAEIFGKNDWAGESVIKGMKSFYREYFSD